MAVFRTLGLACMMFAVTFPWLANYIENMGVAPVWANSNTLATIEVSLLTNWDAAIKPADEQKTTEFEVVGRYSVTQTSLNTLSGAATQPMAQYLTDAGNTKLTSRTDGSAGFGVPAGNRGSYGAYTQRSVGLPTSNFMNMGQQFDEFVKNLEKGLYLIGEVDAQPTAQPDAPNKGKVTSDWEEQKDEASSLAGLAFQAKTSSRVAATFLSWAMLMALAVFTIETFSYLNWIKLGDIWRVPLLAFFAMFLFLLSSLVFLGVEDAARQIINDTYCVLPEKFVSGDDFTDLYKGDTSDRCTVSFTLDAGHVALLMSFAFSFLGFIFFTIAKVKAEWSSDAAKDTSA